MKEDATLKEEVGAVSDGKGLVDVMVGDEDADIAVLELPHDLLDILDGDGVDACEGLVEHDELGLDGQTAGNLRASALTARQLVAFVLAHFLEAELSDEALELLEMPFDEVYDMITELYSDFPIYKDVKREDFRNLFASYKSIREVVQLGDLYRLVSPYDHKSHPYVFVAFPFIDGEIHSFVSDVIDQQRYTNRLITLNDWVIRASAKGLLLVPEDCIPKDMSPEDFADTWAKFNGVIVYSPSKTGAMPHQVASNSTNIGINDMLSLQLKFFEDISGVNASLQGKAGFAGESGQHAQIMAQNAATSLVDLFNSFNEFVREAAYKDVKNIQQYYDPKTISKIVGETSADISNISNAEFDFSIVQSQNTEIAKAQANQFILGLLNQQLIGLEQALEVAKDLPYADALLQSIRTQKEQMDNGQVPEGVSPELMQQAQAQATMRSNPQAMAMLQQALQPKESA